MNELLSAALDYAGRGWPVFPCKPRSKVPATIDGLKAATTDADAIRAWWARWPAANVGVCTGPESGVVVLDVDAQHGGAATLATRYGELPATAQTLTGGGGYRSGKREPMLVRRVECERLSILLDGLLLTAGIDE